MCGIVGGVARRDILSLLIESLRRLEYRGYDSAGIAVIDGQQRLQRVRVQGKVDELQSSLHHKRFNGETGIAHTRWATHGKPSIANAHPHIAGDRVALVHNGIIENHESLRSEQIKLGYSFSSETDTEVIVNQLCIFLQNGDDLLQAVRATVGMLTGSYALAIIDKHEPSRLIAVTKGSSLVIGVGVGEYFVASDVFALLPLTQKFIFLEEGDVADLQQQELTIYNSAGRRIKRPALVSEQTVELIDKAGYRHYMLKEIFAQPQAVRDTLKDRIIDGAVVEAAFGDRAQQVFEQVQAIKIVACGTSYHAGLVAQYWIEELAGIPCSVEVASEFRYRESVVQEKTLFVCISQSGETADTLAALSLAKQKKKLATLAICNVLESSLTRQAELVFLTRAGPEISVASTKAFTTQLVALFLLTLLIAKYHGQDKAQLQALTDELAFLPGWIDQILRLHAEIEVMAAKIAQKRHALYLGRGILLPIAMEGALKLKEISYIHAEAYPAGELKHGPLALVDGDMPIVAVVPNNELMAKLKSNLAEVKARDGALYLFLDAKSEFDMASLAHSVRFDVSSKYLSPILCTIPLQLLAYYVAVSKGIDIDQPRNLAKSVTVE